MVKQVLKTVYEFNDIKEKAIDANRYININDNFWYDFIFDNWKVKLHNNGFENADIYFSGFCSQGDGACFDAKLNLEKLADQYNECIESFNAYTLEAINIKYKHV